jgi:hypothetical protein
VLGVNSGDGVVAAPCSWLGYFAFGDYVKINKLRELIGKQIQWEEYYCPKAGHGLQRRGVLLDVKGKNVLVDQMGSVDWKWVPNMLQLRPVAESK